MKNESRARKIDRDAQGRGCRDDAVQLEGRSGDIDLCIVVVAWEISAFRIVIVIIGVDLDVSLGARRRRLRDRETRAGDVLEVSGVVRPDSRSGREVLAGA